MAARHLIGLALAVLAGCRPAQPIRIKATICGALCGDAPAAGVDGGVRAPDDFRGLDCATSARISFLDAATEQRVGEARCVSLGKPNDLRNLFATSDSPDGGAPPVELTAPRGSRFIVEVAVYAPGGEACPAEAPLLAIGRSAVVDLASQGGDIEVPLGGCRQLCATEQQGITLVVNSLETEITQPKEYALPAGTTLGEIYPYEPLLSTGGVCRAPMISNRSGEFRPIVTAPDSMSMNPNQLLSRFGFDDAAVAGCVAARVKLDEGTVYACLGNPRARDATIWIPTVPKHLTSLLDLGGSGPSGSLVVAIRRTNGDYAVGAQLFFNGKVAQYTTGASWDTLGADQYYTVDGGVAVMTNAPTGRYRVTYSSADGDKVVEFNAGGANDPRSITTMTIFAPP